MPLTHRVDPFALGRAPAYAVAACPTGGGDRCHDPVTGLNSCDRRTDALDNACDFMPEDYRQGDIQRPLYIVQIAVAKAHSLSPDENLIVLRIVKQQFADLKRGSGLFQHGGKNRCSHLASLVVEVLADGSLRPSSALVEFQKCVDGTAFTTTMCNLTSADVGTAGISVSFRFQLGIHAGSHLQRPSA